MYEQDKLNDYDSEPVLYCATCLSLNIKHDESTDSDYCQCGCTDIRECLPEEWEKKYENKYGHKYVEKSEGNIKNSPIFQLSFSKLMAKVSDSPKWESIIQQIYGRVPKGLSKADSIVVFFDKLIKDNKLDALRTLLYKMGF